MTGEKGSAEAFLSALANASDWADFCALNKLIPKESEQKAEILDPLIERIRKMDNSEHSDFRLRLMTDLATVAAATPTLAHKTLATYFELAGAPSYPEGILLGSMKPAKTLVAKALKKQKDNDVLETCVAAFRNATFECRPKFWEARLALLKWVVENEVEVSDDDRAIFAPFSVKTTASLKALGQLPLVSPKKSKRIFKTVDHSEEKEKTISYFDAYMMAWLQNVPQDLRLTGDDDQVLRVNMVEPRIYGKKPYLAWGWLETNQKEVCFLACVKYPTGGEPSIYYADHEPPQLVESHGLLSAFLDRLKPTWVGG